MSKGPKTRGSYGPTSPRGIYTKSVRAPGVSLDMPDGEPVKKRVGGKIKKMSAGGVGGHPDRSKRGAIPLPNVKTTTRGGAGTNEPYYQRSVNRRDGTVVEVEELPGMKKGGKVSSSASKRADGCATKGKTRGKFV